MINEIFYQNLLDELINMSDSEWNKMNSMFDDITENYQCVALPDELFDNGSLPSRDLVYPKSEVSITQKGFLSDSKNISFMFYRLFSGDNLHIKGNYKDKITYLFDNSSDIIDVSSNDYSVAANDEQYAIAA